MQADVVMVNNLHIFAGDTIRKTTQYNAKAHHGKQDKKVGWRAQSSSKEFFQQQIRVRGSKSNVCVHPS